MQRTEYVDIRSRLDFTKYKSAWIFGLMQDAALVAAAIFAARTAGWAGSALASVILSCVYFRAFGFMHEAVHGIFSSKRALNDALGLFWGTLCFLPYAQWREGHLEHHYWAGNIEKDPVMKLCLHVKNGGKFGRIIELSWRCWLPALAVMQQLVFWTNSFRYLRAGKASFLSWASFLAPLLVWPAAAYLIGGRMALQVLLPSVFLYLLFVEIVNIPHHLELVQRDGEHKFQVWDQHLVSRSCVYPRWFERGVLLNFNFHSEHHLFPTLPYKQLEKAHGLLKPAFEGKEGFNVEAGFEWIRRNRRRPLTEVLYTRPEEAPADQMKRSS